MYRDDYDVLQVRADALQVQPNRNKAREGIVYLLCIFLVVGPLWLSLGVDDLTDAVEDARGDAIEATEEAIEAWGSSSAELSFKNQSFMARISTPGCGSSSCPCYANNVTLTVSTQPTDKYVDSSAEIEPYSQVKYIGYVPDTIVQLCPLRVDIVDTIREKIVSSFSTTMKAALEFDVSEFSHECPPVVVDTNDYRECMSACNNMLGVFTNTQTEGPRCSIESYIRSLCVKLSQDSAGNWVEDGQEPGQGGGCFYKPPSLVEIDGQGVPGGLEFLYQQWSQQNSYNWPQGFYIYVRASADPYLVYEKVTQGTGMYGIPKAALIWRGTMFTLIGGMMTIVWLLSCGLGWGFIIKRQRELRDLRDKGIVVGMPAEEVELQQISGAYPPGTYAVPMTAIPMQGVPVAPPMPGGYPQMQMPLPPHMLPPTYAATIPAYPVSQYVPDPPAAAAPQQPPRMRNGYEELRTDNDDEDLQRQRRY